MPIRFGPPTGAGVISLRSLTRGPQGPAATVAVGTVTELAPGATPTVENTGTSGAAVLAFGLPGTPTIEVGDVSTLAPGATPTVTNGGSATAIELDFGLPTTPTVTVGSTTTLSAGSSATVTNGGTASAIELDFGIPRGADASLKWTYESSTSMAAPATGGMRFNNASLASVTAIAVNAETSDPGNPDQSDFVIKWDDSTSTPKGYLEIREEAGSSAVYEISTVTDNTTWLQIDVTFVSGDISLTAGDKLYFTPHLIGNKGTDGAGTGDVVGPASSVSGNLASFDDTDGKSIADSGIAAGNVLVDADIGVAVQGYDADTLKADTADVLTAGFAGTPFNAGTKTTGTFTPDEASGNLQYAVNGGAHTLAPPTNNCMIVIQYTNNASAGAVTTSGFTKVDGSFTTTDGHDFFVYVTKLNGFSHLNIIRLQ